MTLYLCAYLEDDEYLGDEQHNRPNLILRLLEGEEGSNDNTEEKVKKRFAEILLNTKLVQRPNHWNHVDIKYQIEQCEIRRESKTKRETLDRLYERSNEMNKEDIERIMRGVQVSTLDGPNIVINLTHSHNIT